LKVNYIHIAGHLGSDPVTRFTASGQKVTTFTVAVNGRKGGNEVTTWFRITVWGDRFDKMIGYLKKGSAIIVVGELSKPEIWTDKEGRPQVTLEVTAEMLKFSPFGKPDRAGGEQSSNRASSSQNYQEGGQEGFGEQSFSSGSNAFGGSQGGYSQSGHGGSGYGAEETEEDKVPF
jgi:single-strand DNA-binding protein